MVKIVVLGNIPKKRGLDILTQLIATSLENFEYINKNEVHSLDDLQDIASTIVEMLEYDKLSPQELKREIEGLERNLELTRKPLDKLPEIAQINPVEDQVPWYERFEKKSKKDRFNYNSKAFNTKKKWTRKKWIPSLFKKRSYEILAPF